MDPVRWGILSTAGIADRMHDGFTACTNATVVAVASRSLEKAAEWAEKRGVPKSYGSYAELLDDPEVDAVYVPLPTAMHYEWCVKAAAKGKHVLCEKPAAGSAKELSEILAACSASGVQFMDGVMFMHNERMPAMSERIHTLKVLGPLKRVVAAFSFLFDDPANIRMKTDLEPMGCLGDLGWYTTRFIMWAFQYDLPVRVRATHWKFSPGGALIECDATLSWEDGRVASFDTSFTACKRQWAEVLGTEGRLTLQDFCSSKSPEDFEFVEYMGPSAAAATHYVRKTAPQHHIEAQTFSAIVQDVKHRGADALQPFWAQVAMKTQVVVDAVWESVQHDGATVSVVAPVF